MVLRCKIPILHIVEKMKIGKNLKIPRLHLISKKNH